MNGLCCLWQKLFAAYTRNQFQYVAVSFTISLSTKDHRQFLHVKHFQKFNPAASLALISFSETLMPQTVETVPNQGHPSRLYVCSCVEIAWQWIFQFRLNFIISVALIGRTSYRLRALGFFICFCSKQLCDLEQATQLILPFIKWKCGLNNRKINTDTQFILYWFPSFPAKSCVSSSVINV